MVIVVMGVAGSGKSTVARGVAQQLGVAFLDADDLHSVEARASMRLGIALTDSERDRWMQRVVHAAADHSPVVVACSALRRQHRDMLRGIGVVEFDYLRVPADELERRLAGRSGHFFDPALLPDQLEVLEEPEGDDVRVLDGTRPVGELVEQIVTALRGRFR